MNCPIAKELMKDPARYFPSYGIYKGLKPERIEERNEFIKLINNQKEVELYSFPNFFVGEYAYPNPLAGYMMTSENLIGNPRGWYGKSLEEFIFERSMSLRAKEKMNVKDYELQLSSASTKPLYLEATTAKQITVENQKQDLLEPSGFSGLFQKVKVLSNYAVPTKVENIIDDKIKVSEALPEFIESGYDNYYFQNLLSAGLLGKEKKLVPTKWSITASDDLIAKKLLENIRQYDQVDSIQFFENEYLDNHFGVIVLPGPFSYEQFETLESSGTSSQEYEYYKGRKKYASKQGGGYYAARLPICEYLEKVKKQARVIMIREIGPAYTVPVGVWEVRENVRKALEKLPLTFNSLTDLKNFMKVKFVRSQETIKKSILASQLTLSTNWF